MRKISLKRLAKLGGVMPRSSITSPRRPIKAKPRSAKEFARIYGSVERVEFVKSLPCTACRRVAQFGLEIVNAHTENGGTSRKANHTTIIPLCSTADRDGCHDWQHQSGWGILRLDDLDKRRALAAAVNRAWLAHLNRTAAETADDR